MPPYPAVRIPAKAAHTATVIFLHGLGDSGAGWMFLAEEARKAQRLNHVKFVFPEAPQQPVSLNFGMRMPSWYDIKELANVNAAQDEAGILESVGRLESLIKEETDAGVPASRIVIGGFSQGCAVSLATGGLTQTKLGGIVGLSGYVPIKDYIQAQNNTTNQDTPMFLAHGTADQVIRFDYGKLSRDFIINELKFKNVSWHQYEGLTHSCGFEEISDILNWLEATIQDA